MEIQGMINELITQLNKFEERTDCSKNFLCIKDPLKDPCLAKYHAIADLMECLDEQSKTCEFSAPFSATYVCMCPLRKLIAINFEVLSKKDNLKSTD